MAIGFDTTENCAPLAAQIKANGYDFVARYLSQSAWKVIKKPEADALRGAGLSIVLVYEDAGDNVGYFSEGRGEIDGNRAAQQVGLLGLDHGTVYFAVDFDALANEIAGPITDYFNGVAHGLRGVTAQSGIDLEIGVYGSGLTCKTLISAGLATKGWLAQSRGWQGYSSYSTWSIRQKLSTTILGLSVDPDDAVGDYGAFS